jgi:hypothetical protein
MALGPISDYAFNVSKSIPKCRFLRFWATISVQAFATTAVPTNTVLQQDLGFAN